MKLAAPRRAQMKDACMGRNVLLEGRSPLKEDLVKVGNVFRRLEDTTSCRFVGALAFSSRSSSLDSTENPTGISATDNWQRAHMPPTSKSEQGHRQGRGDTPASAYVRSTGHE
eukprot:scaffold207_cov409-Prasinococcus_capsulatus_cf.AAC.37